MKQLFYRNVRAADHLEIFLVSAVGSLLLLRFYLKITGYPQVGGGSLHIAHMLYGGLLMMAAIVLLVSFLGARVQRFSALIGGIGFGIFIDELGKFITKDNNYFFRPTIGIIYALFIMLYLVFNALSQKATYTAREYELNALAQFEEAVLEDLDTAERRSIRQLLQRADQSSPVTQQLQTLLGAIETVAPPTPGFLRRTLHAIDSYYERFWQQAVTRRLIGVVFVVYALYFVAAAGIDLIRIVQSGDGLFSMSHSYPSVLLIGQLAAASVAAGFAVYGSVKLFSSRRLAFEAFRRTLLINLLLTEFFIFSRIQFAAFPGFMIGLIMIIGVRYAIGEENRQAQPGQQK